MKPIRSRLLSLAITLALCTLPLAQTACGENELAVVKTSSSIVSANLANADILIDSLERGQGISKMQSDALRAAFARLSEKYDALDAEIQKITRLDADAAMRVLPAAEAFVLQLQAENLIPSASPKVQARFKAISAVLNVIGPRIVARLKGRAGSVAEMIRVKREVSRFREDAGELQKLMRVAA